MTENEILERLPDLEREEIRTCLEFAADREQTDEQGQPVDPRGMA